ncbi:MAG: LarC family nickel insertion protein [Rhodocyclaceae bacterium]|nr:LarC family nickel insertion protein [Rhodocyclaceae bacterium]
MSARHLHLQPVGGIAGDMFVAAVLDAFPEFRDPVLADVAAVLPPEAGEPGVRRVMRHGISATHFSLPGAEGTAAGPPAGEGDAGEPAAADRGEAREARPYRPAPRAGNGPAAVPAGGGAHAAAPDGDYRSLRARIEGAGLPAATAMHALGILEILARAESGIHDQPLDDVHFHELAGFDSLMDVVAAGSIVAALGTVTWSLEALPLGSGRVKTAHGWLPVPAPATARILEGYPWHADAVPGERVTPTGAAILRYLVPPEHCRRKPAGMLVASGYGAGSRDLAGVANVLRVLAFDPDHEDAFEADDVIALEFDVDDMTGEEIGIAATRLRALDGILDLVLLAGQGKKGRPVTSFRMLVEPGYLDDCVEAVFHETSTIGFRYSTMNRVVLKRHHRRSEGGLRIKEVIRPKGLRTRKVESDDLAPAGDLFERRARRQTEEGSP